MHHVHPSNMELSLSPAKRAEERKRRDRVSNDDDDVARRVELDRFENREEEESDSLERPGPNRASL